MPKFSLDRRQFAIGAAAAVTGLVLPGNALPGNALSANILEAQPSFQATGADPSLEAKTQAAMAKLTPAAQKEVEMKVASIFRKYGDHLSDEQKADIRRIMAESQEGLEKMRTFKLDNGDQPADAFQAYRTEAKAPQHFTYDVINRPAKTGEGKK
jgi:hypothetical protein